MVAKRSSKSSLVRVHDVAQEYWYIEKTPCTCGGRFQLVNQQLSRLKGKSMDVMTMACRLCGKTREFRFDISSFHGDDVTRHKAAITELAEQVDDETLKLRLVNAMEPPVVHAMQTIMDLADKGDQLALDWLLDAILDPHLMDSYRA